MAWPNITSRCCFMLGGGGTDGINGNPLHPIHSTNFVSVRLINQAFKPLHFRNSNALTRSASKSQHAQAPAQGSAPGYALAGQEQGDIERDLEFTSSHMNSKYADCCLLKLSNESLPLLETFARGGRVSGEELSGVHRWDPGKHRPCFLGGTAPALVSNLWKRRNNGGSWLRPPCGVG